MRRTALKLGTLAAGTLLALSATPSGQATAADTEVHDRHAEELTASGSMLVAYALTPRELATGIPARTASSISATLGRT